MSCLLDPMAANVLAWKQEAARIDKDLYAQLEAIGFVKPEVFDALNDLDAGGATEHLNSLLGRTCSLVECNRFRNMIERAAPFAYTKRRRTVVNMNHPELEVDIKATRILTEREQLLAKIPGPLQKGAVFPSCYEAPKG